MNVDALLTGCFSCLGEPLQLGWMGEGQRRVLVGYLRDKVATVHFPETYMVWDEETEAWRNVKPSLEEILAAAQRVVYALRTGNS